MWKSILLCRIGTVTAVVLSVVVIGANAAFALNIEYEKGRRRAAAADDMAPQQAMDFLTGIMESSSAGIFDKTAAYEKALESGGWLFDGALFVKGRFAPSDAQEQLVYGEFPDIMSWFDAKQEQYTALRTLGRHIKLSTSEITELYSMAGSRRVRELADVLIALLDEPDRAAAFLTSELNAMDPTTENGVLRAYYLIAALSFIGNDASVDALSGFLMAMSHEQLCQDAVFGLAISDRARAVLALRQMLQNPIPEAFEILYPTAVYALFAHGPRQAVPAFGILVQNGATQAIRDTANRVLQGDLGPVLAGQQVMRSATKDAYIKVWNGFGVVVRDNGYEVNWIGFDSGNAEDS